jgi:PAS domain S-box-containing protein
MDKPPPGAWHDRFAGKLQASTALRYALAPACIALTVLLNVSALGPYLHPTALFLAGVVAAAWFGGAGPGLLAALLATLVLPQLIIMSYPLTAGFFDLPRFLVFGLTAAAVGWGTTSRRRAEEALRRSELELRHARSGLETGIAQQTAALRESEERYARAMQATNDGLWEWNPRTDAMFVSARARELFGVPDGVEIRTRVDLKAHGGFHPEDRQRIEATIQAGVTRRSGGFELEYRVIDPAGKLRWIRSRGKAFPDAQGGPALLTGSLTDITERKRDELALAESEARFRRAQRLEATGTLAGGIAHDFNNILGAILGYGEMALRDAPKGSRLRRDLDSITTAGERGRALVDRILTFSRSGVGERVAVPVEKVVREALDLLRAKLPPDITVETALRAGPAAMRGDPTQVHQVLMNLGTNAVQAMSSGGTLSVSLEVRHFDAPRPATIGIIAAGDCVVLEVADTGAGIPPDIVDRIFDPFFTTKDVGVGTGLGLSLVHGIVTDVGGAIDVASIPGSGSAFAVYFPRSGDAPQPSTQDEPALPRGNGQRVLIVDDEEPLVRLAARTLEELGYVPLGFHSSAAALAAFRAAPEGFDALVTDERMPGMPGSALIREVRRIRSSIPIVLMSGYVGGAVARRARDSGADEVLKKPLSARELATSLARVLQKAQVPAAPLRVV